MRDDEHRNIYPELCGKSFDDAAAADRALASFWSEVYALRIKYGIRDVSLIASGNVRDSGPFMWSAHAGSQCEAEVMAAWHLGKAQAERQEMIRNAAEEAMTQAIKKPKNRR